MALKKQNSESQSKSKKSLSSHVKKAMKKWSRSKAETFKDTDFSKWKFD